MDETRTFAEPIEVRGEPGRLVARGVAIRYNTRSRVLAGPRGDFREEIRAGAVAKTLQEQDVVALHEHDPKMLLGRLSAGTLRLEDTPNELRYEIDLPDTTAGRDVATLLERRDLKGASFGFRAIADTVEWSTADGVALRSIGAIRLRDVSTTAFPAYGDATSAEKAFRAAGLEDSELRSLLDAAQRGELADVLALRDYSRDETDNNHDGDDGRVTTVFRPHYVDLV